MNSNNKINNNNVNYQTNNQEQKFYTINNDNKDNKPNQVILNEKNKNEKNTQLINNPPVNTGCQLTILLESANLRKENILEQVNTKLAINNSSKITLNIIVYTIGLILFSQVL